MAIDFVKIDKKATSFKRYCEKGSWLEYSEKIEEFIYEAREAFTEKAEVIYQIDNFQDTVFADVKLYELRDIVITMKNNIEEVYTESVIVAKTCKFLDDLYHLCNECIEENKKIVAVVD